MIVLACDKVEVIQTVVHASVLYGKHGIAGLLAPALCSVIHPVAESRTDIFSRSIAGCIVDIHQAGDELVHCVPRHPCVIEDICLAHLNTVELPLNIAVRRNRCCPQEAAFSL